MVKYRIQIASANNSTRFDKSVKSPYWEDAIGGSDDLQTAVNDLLRALNDEDIILDNQWLRMVIDGKVVNF